MVEMEVLQRSFYGGVLILVVIAIRAVLLDKLPKRTFLILWGVTLLRLLVPYSFSSAFSVYTMLGQKLGTGPVPEAWQGQAAQDHAGYDAGKGFAPGVVLVQLTGQQAASVDGNMSAFRNELSVLWVIWCAGVCICAVIFITVYFRCLREFRTALPVEDSMVQGWLKRRKLRRKISVRQSDRISAPLTYGIFRPVILLPKKLALAGSRELEYVLQHEYMHILHYDAAFKIVLAAVLCIHWFNPLVWVMYGLMNRDIELACDEGVLRRLGEQSRSGYALTLIKMEEKHSGLAALHNGFSRNAIERRIKSIMNYKKETIVTIMVGMLLVITVVVIFATSAQNIEAAGADIDPVGNGAGIEDTEGIMDSPKGDTGIFAGETEVGEKNFGADLSGATAGISGTDSAAADSETGNVSDYNAEIRNTGNVSDHVAVTGNTDNVSDYVAEPEPWQSMPESVYRKVQGMPDMEEFWKTYLAGDINTLKQYLAEDFKGDPDVFPDGADGHNAEKAELLAIRWEKTGGSEIGDTMIYSLEILPGEEESLEYLTVCLIKEQDGWKVSWYGLEK